MPYKDPEVRRTKHREYMQRYLDNEENRERHYERVKRNNKRYGEQRKTLLEQFREGGCALCGEDEPCCLSAHHLDPTAKDFNIAQGARMNVSVKKFKEELSKCVCLCENCHRKVHAGILKLCSKARRRVS